MRRFDAWAESRKGARRVWVVDDFLDTRRKLVLSVKLFEVCSLPIKEQVVAALSEAQW